MVYSRFSRSGLLRRDGAVRADLLTSIAVVLMLTAGASGQIANPGFESGFTSGVAQDWTLLSTSGYGVSGQEESANVHGGARAQKISLPQPLGEGYGGIFQTINTVAGQTYRLSFWVYASVIPEESYPGEDFGFFVGFDTAGRNLYDESLVDWDISWLGVNTGSGEWGQHNREFIAGGSSATIFFKGWRKYGQHGGSHFIVDDVAIETVPVGHLPSHGALPAPAPPTRVGPNQLANPDFENGFSAGVANNWQNWTTRGAGTFKATTDRGKIGGGHYNPDGGAAFVAISATSKVAFAMPPSLGALGEIKAGHPEVLTIGRL